VIRATTPEARSGAVKEAAASERHLHKLLVAEREPSLEKLIAERDPDPEFYAPLSTLLEENIRGLVRDWNGRL
jgi:hypothetical protein